MKKIKINVPEGYEIDRELSTLEEIVFKKIGLPKSWEELGQINGWFTTNNSNVRDMHEVSTFSDNKNLFATEEQARASIALAQLTQLREVYRGGWKPNWDDTDMKYVISKNRDSIVRSLFTITQHFLAFQSEEIRDKFLNNFRDLIEKASPLLFG